MFVQHLGFSVFLSTLFWRVWVDKRRTRMLFRFHNNSYLHTFFKEKQCCWTTLQNIGLKHDWRCERKREDRVLSLNSQHLSHFLPFQSLLFWLIRFRAGSRNAAVWWSILRLSVNEFAIRLWSSIVFVLKIAAIRLLYSTLTGYHTPTSAFTKSTQLSSLLRFLFFGLLNPEWFLLVTFISNAGLTDFDLLTVKWIVSCLPVFENTDCHFVGKSTKFNRCKCVAHSHQSLFILFIWA